MGNLRGLGILTLIIAVLALAVGGISVVFLYQRTAEVKNSNLTAAIDIIVKATERTPSTTADPLTGNPRERQQAILATVPWLDVYRLLDAHDAVTLALPLANGDALVIDPAQREKDGAIVSTPVDHLPLPVRNALAGQSGNTTVEGTGNQPLQYFAFAPVPSLKGAIAVKTDLDAFRRPYLRAAGLLAASAVTLSVLGIFVFSLLSDPIVRRIREGEARFRELFENLRSGAAIHRAVNNGETFIVSEFNQAAERILGVRRDELVGQPLGKVLPQAGDNGLIDVMRRVQRGGSPEFYPPTYWSGPHTEGWRECYVYQLPSGEIVTLFDDVTDRKNAEESLKDSESRWRSIIEMQSVAIILIDSESEIRFANKAAEQLFQQPADDLVGAPFGFPVVHGDVAEIEIIRPGRGLAYAEMRAVPMRWSGENHFLLFIQDVSAYKRAQGDLRKLFQAIEQSPASVVITDVSGRIEYVNPKFTDATGYTYSEVVGKMPNILKSGHSSPDEYRKLWETITAGNVWRGEFLNKKKNGDLFWEIASIAPVRDVTDKITHYVAVKEDITERKATEERLRQSQRMEVIGQLTGGIAHDFNNLLAIILGNLQLLEEESGIDREAQELIADALWSAERGAQLTHRLLAFARRQRLNPKPIDINHVVGEMIDLLRRTLGDRIQINEDLSDGVWLSMIDRGQLESALLNLVVNARDAMRSGGTLTLTTANASFTADDASRPEDVIPGDYVVLGVRDTGIGMAPDVLVRIFEPFFTTKKFGQGSGLGLSMVYGFVRQSGGHIAVDSRPGGGTAVRLFLPKAAPMETAAGPTRDGRGRPASGGEVILVVEDDARVRKTSTNILRRYGYRVFEASDADDALRLIETLPQLDLLFTDVILSSGINGSQLARRVRERRPETRILFTSGYATEAMISGDSFDGPVDLLPKPYRRGDLAVRIREILDRASS